MRRDRESAYIASVNYALHAHFAVTACKIEYWYFATVGAVTCRIVRQ